MSKPIEETWERYNDPDAGDFCIRTTDGRRVLSSDEGTTFDDLNIAMASPDMARALIGLLEMRNDGSRHLRGACTAWDADACDDDDCRAVRAALTKAGVPLS